MGRKKELRQFQCEECDGRTWFERAARSECHECGEDGRSIPKGEEIGVFACKFLCKCGSEYTVLCEMTDTAECYGCGEQDVAPFGFWPRGYINKRTQNKHSCSKCRGNGNCPNLAAIRRRVQSHHA